MAFVYFQKQKVDIAVLEVGLGGRLDATNVCKPLVSVSFIISSLIFCVVYKLYIELLCTKVLMFFIKPEHHNDKTSKKIKQPVLLLIGQS